MALAPLQPGDPRRAGPYALRARLGSGGMGQVFLADGPRGERVAVKLLHAHVAADADARARLTRELRTLTRVRGPHLAEVVDADVDAPRPFLVTRHVPGPTLAERVTESGPLDDADLLALARGLAAALAAVHAAGVVHRDLKPGNVVCGPAGPTLLDFGIASAVDEAALTRSGEVWGTAAYLAPEQVLTGVAEPASDVHALGATLAYAAAGRPLFGTGPADAVLYRVVHDTPSPPPVPPPLAGLLSRMLARTPAERPTSAEVARALGAPVPAGVAAPAGAGAAVGAGLGAAVGAGATTLTRPATAWADPPVASPPAAAPPATSPPTRVMPTPTRAMPIPTRAVPAAPPSPRPAAAPLTRGPRDPWASPPAAGDPRPAPWQSAPPAGPHPSGAPVPAAASSPSVRRDRPRLTAGPAWGRLVAACVVLATAAGALVAPLLVPLVAYAVALPLHDAAGRSHAQLAERRFRRGPRATDGARAAVTLPAHTVGALGAALLWLPFRAVPGLAAWGVGFLAALAAGTDTPTAVRWGCAVLTGTLAAWLLSPRRRPRAAAARAALRHRVGLEGTLGAAFALGLLAVALLSVGLTGDPTWAPLSQQPQLPDWLGLLGL